MIHSFKVTNPSGEFLFIELTNPASTGFFVRSIEGLGPIKSTVNTTESLAADGGWFNSVRLNMRNIVLDMGFYNDHLDTIETLRKKSYRFFPMKKELLFEIATDDRTGIARGYIESNEPNIFSNEEGTQISILCPDPFFYEAEPVTTLYTGIDDNFEFPFENASLSDSLIEIGILFIGTEATLYYTGDIPTGVTITINFFGPVTNLSIHNLTGGQDMTINTDVVTAISGAPFQVGDIVIISTVIGLKKIFLFRDGLAYNILNAFGISTQWIVIEKGDNVITYTATSGIGNVQLSIVHNIVYEGL